MRLLDAKTLRFWEFIGEEKPAYAILSHTWTDDEPSYQDWLRQDPSLEKRKGYDKIRRCCTQAIADDIDFVWADTICINKESSADLSEAINSMFAWYEGSAVCYAYLADVQSLEGDQLERSKWFTRGWTLQELLAPYRVSFYSADWTLLGSKTKQPLLGRLAAVTRIRPEFLRQRREPLAKASVAVRMSWASTRTTTRPEDLSYCLLGIFDVNMPLLYGEGGRKAFVRLQQEIIRSSADTTIFCWHADNFMSPSISSMLSPSPTQFYHSGIYEFEVENHPFGRTASFEMTNTGLRVQLPFLATEWGLLIPLPGAFARTDGCAKRMNCAIGVARPSMRPDQYVRVSNPPRPVLCDGLHMQHISWKPWPHFYIGSAPHPGSIRDDDINRAALMFRGPWSGSEFLSTPRSTPDRLRLLFAVDDIVHEPGAGRGRQQHNFLYKPFVIATYGLRRDEQQNGFFTLGFEKESPFAAAAADDDHDHDDLVSGGICKLRFPGEWGDDEVLWFFVGVYQHPNLGGGSGGGGGPMWWVEGLGRGHDEIMPALERWQPQELDVLRSGLLREARNRVRVGVSLSATHSGIHLRGHQVGDGHAWTKHRASVSIESPQGMAPGEYLKRDTVCVITITDH